MTIVTQFIQSAGRSLCIASSVGIAVTLAAALLLTPVPASARIDAGSVTFGKVTAVRNSPREMLFAVKLYF